MKTLKSRRNARRTAAATSATSSDGSAQSGIRAQQQAPQQGTTSRWKLCKDCFNIFEKVLFIIKSSKVIVSFFHIFLVKVKRKKTIVVDSTESPVLTISGQLVDADQQKGGEDDLPPPTYEEAIFNLQERTNRISTNATADRATVVVVGGV